MPLTTSSITHFLMTPKLQPDYLNKAYKQQPVRYGLFAKGLAGCESHQARIELPAPPQRFSKLSKFSTAQVVPSVGAG
jgi:hypothetical protein